MAASVGKKPIAWWELWPTIESDEMAAYAALGVGVTIAHKKGGQLILIAEWPRDGEAILELEIRYSPLHPFVRPDIAARKIELSRHQHLLGKELCLLTQESRQWDSTQLVADYIHERLPIVFGAAKAHDEGRLDDAASLEEHSPDPKMPYFTSIAEPSSIVYFNGDMPLPTGSAGLLDLQVVARPDVINPGAIEATVRRLRTLHGDPIGMPIAIPRTADSATDFKGVWVRMDAPRDNNVRATYDEVRGRLLTEKKLQGSRAARSIDAVVNSPSYFIGISFQEEVSYGKSGAGWLFLIVRNAFKPGKPTTGRVNYVRGERIGETYVYSRLPVARSLRGKKVLQVGCGAIGSFVALELARSGIGHLNLVDGDVALPGNSLRWPLGRPAWGISKSMSLARFIEENYPWTHASAEYTRLGTSSGLDTVGLSPDDLRKSVANLQAAIAEVDLVLDTSASSEIQHALAYFAKEGGKPFVTAHATMGVAGGIVATFKPNSTACWVCLQERLRDGSIPEPRINHSGAITPVGCNEPTFTGGGFDLQEVSLEVVRRVVGILSDGAYDAGPWDVSVLNLVDDTGKRILPEWTPFALSPHPRCCGSHT